MAHTTKEEFISKYLNNNKRLKKHNLPYGIKYLNLLAEVEEKAERKWNKLNNQNKYKL